MQIRVILLFFLLLTICTSNAQSAKKVDEYANIKKEDASARLDNFVNELMMNPDATAYIITYGGSKGISTAKARADFAKQYLITERGLIDSRLVIIDGGLKKEPATELWIVPFGAPPPVASPTIKSKPVKGKIHD
jgi:hypothetical protein